MAPMVSARTCWLPRWLSSSLVLLISTLATVQASIMTFSRDGMIIPGRPAWKAKQTIKVFVEEDPVAKQKRHEVIKKGVLRWQDQLKDRNGNTIEVEFFKGAVPKGAAEGVLIRWNDGKITGKNGDENDGLTATSIFLKGTKAAPSIGRVSNAEVKINQAPLVKGDQYIENLAMHEFGHAIGFADDPTPAKKPHNVMDHSVQEDTPLKFTDRDIMELDSLYPKAQPPPPKEKIKGKATQQPTGEYRYEYEVEWQGGGTIPLFEIGTNGRNTFNIQAGLYDVDGTNAFNPTPDGWFLFDPRDPFTDDGYMEDLDYDPISPGMNLNYLSFVNQINPIGLNTSTFFFSFDSRAAPATVLAYASGEDVVQVVGPQAIPEPVALVLLASGFAVSRVVFRRCFRPVRRPDSVC